MKSLSHCRKVLLVSQSSFLDTAMKWILTCSTLKAQAWFWYEPSRVKELHSFTKPLKTTTNILKKKKRDTLKCLLILLVFTSPAVNTQKSSEGVFIVLQQVKGQCCSHLKNKCTNVLNKVSCKKNCRATITENNRSRSHCVQRTVLMISPLHTDSSDLRW